MTDGQDMDGDEIDFLSRKLVSLRAIHWGGALPSPGHFIKTERGEFAYQIVTVRENQRPDPKSRALFKCWKVPAARLPRDAVVHPWQWSARG